MLELLDNERAGTIVAIVGYIMNNIEITKEDEEEMSESDFGFIVLSDE